MRTTRSTLVCCFCSATECAYLRSLRLRNFLQACDIMTGTACLSSFKCLITSWPWTFGTTCPCSLISLIMNLSYAHVFSAVDQLLNKLKDEIRLPFDFAVWIKEVVQIRIDYCVLNCFSKHVFGLLRVIFWRQLQQGPLSIRLIIEAHIFSKAFVGPCC